MPKTPKNLPPLGDVELAVLDFLWNTQSGSVQEVHAVVGQTRSISANTVGSALERLYKKSLLQREKVSHSYRYRPTIDRETFQARKVVEAAGGIRALRDRGVLAAFVDLVADSDGTALTELERLVKMKKEGAK